MEVYRVILPDLRKACGIWNSSLGYLRHYTAIIIFNHYHGTLFAGGTPRTICQKLHGYFFSITNFEHDLKSPNGNRISFMKHITLEQGLAPPAAPTVITVYDMVNELFAKDFPVTDNTVALKRIAVDRADAVIWHLRKYKA